MTDPRVAPGNVLWMLAYAWGSQELVRRIPVGLATSAAPREPFAVALVAGVSRALRRGLPRVYEPRLEECVAVRGRVDIKATVRTASHVRGRLWCAFDELTADSEPNRIVRDALRAVSSDEECTASTRSHAASLARRLSFVAGPPVSRSRVARVVISSSDRDAALLLELAKIIVLGCTPMRGRRGSQFLDTRDESAMNMLFEAFLRGFYAHHRPDLDVRRRVFVWAETEEMSAVAARLLPRMETDVTISGESESMIIDAKYYRSPLRSGYMSGPRFHETHLYQMFSYLMNFRHPRTGGAQSGLLLYPQGSGDPVSEVFGLHGFQLRIATVDLCASWDTITSQLLGLLEGFDA